MHSFSIGESLRFGWRKTRQHSGLLFQILLTYFALQVVQEIVNRVLQDTLLGVLANLAIVLVGVVLSAGTTRIVLKLAEGHAAHYRDLIPPGRLAWYFFCVSLVAGLLTFAGLLLLVIPGIYVLLRFSMARFAVIEGAGILESLKRSSAITYGRTWHLLGFFVVLLLMNILGAILLLVGLLITVPVSMLAWAQVYLKLKAHHA